MLEIESISIVCNIISLVGLTYAIIKIKELERWLYSIPDANQVFEEKMKTKIPIIFDGAGNPMPLAGGKTPQKTTPAYVG